MKPDIATKKDIKFITTKFYDKLLADEIMLPFFEDIVAKKHIEIISDFWNDLLFYTSTYKNNTMQKYLDKNAFVKFEKEHFTSWISYFFETIDAYFEGENANNMKNRARSIAIVMELKMGVYK